MKGYTTKKEILESMGKNGKDVRYLDRALVSGRVIMMWGRYYKQKEYIEWLWERDEEYKKEIESLKGNIAELEYQLANASCWDDREMAKKIYKYLTLEKHIPIDYSEFMEYLDL